MLRQILANFPNFSGFKESDIDWMLSVGGLTECHTGEILIQEGQLTIDKLYILLEGTLKVLVSQAGGVDDGQEIDRISPGKIVGTLSFVDNRPSSSTVIALEKSRMLALPKHLLLKKQEQDTDFAAHFYQMLSVSLSQQLRSLSDFLTKNNVVPESRYEKFYLYLQF